MPEDQKSMLAQQLAAQFGRGGKETQLSLSRALCALGEVAVAPFLQRAMTSEDANVSAHAKNTERLLREPDAGSEFAVNQVKRMLAPG